MSSQTRQSPAPTPPAVPDQHDLGSTDTTIDLMVRWFHEFGDTYRVYAPRRKSWTWVIHHPKDIKRVLVTNHRNYTKGVGIDRVRLSTSRRTRSVSGTSSSTSRAAGPRHCIGENFSLHEMLLHLNMATRRFRLRVAETEPVTIEARINLRPARDLIMRVETR